MLEDQSAPTNVQDLAELNQLKEFLVQASNNYFRLEEIFKYSIETYTALFSLYGEEIKADALLKLTFLTSIKSWDAKQQKFVIDLSLEAKQKDLVEFALRKGANPNVLDRFVDFPSESLSDLLLNNEYHKFDANNFLKLVFSTNIKRWNDPSLEGKQKDLVEFALRKGANPNVLGWFDYLPSESLSDLLLNNEYHKLDASDFLKLIFSENIKSWDSERRRYVIDPSLEGKQKALVEFALKAGADPNVLDRFIGFPSESLSDLLLNNEYHKFDANKFLKLIFPENIKSWDSERRRYVIDPSLEAKQSDLVELALKAGANSNVLARLPNLPSESLSDLLLNNEYHKFDSSRFLKLVLSANTKSWDSEQRIHVVDPSLEAKQKALVELALKAGANPNVLNRFVNFPSESLSELLLNNEYHKFEVNNFLKLVLSKSTKSWDSEQQSHVISPSLETEQKDLVEFALKAGANPNVLDRFIGFPSESLSELLLNNEYYKLGVNNFLKLVLLTSIKGWDSEQQIYVIDPSLEAEQKDLTEFALMNGADPNQLEAFPVQSYKTMELLFNNDYRTLESDSVCQKMFLGMGNIFEEGLDYLIENPDMVFHMKYQNLEVEAASEPKIPRIVHHLWLTNSKAMKEISEEDIGNVMRTKDIFSQSGQQWEHIVWTNDKSFNS